MRKTALLLAALVLATAMAGVAAADVENNVEASPQVTLGDNVTVDEASIDGDGFLVIHTESDGDNHTEDSVIAVEELDEGEHEDLLVELDEPLEERQLLYAALYFSGDEFDFDNASQAERETDEGFEDVEDSFYVVIGDVTALDDFEDVDVDLRESYQTLANNLQDRHEFRQRLDELQAELEELEDSDDPDVEESKEELRNSIEDLEAEIEELDAQIANRTELINDILEATDELEDEEEEDDVDDPNGLPGFTAVAAILSLVAFALIGRRHD